MRGAITPFLWYDRDAEEAAHFYAATFPNSSVDRVHRSPADYPSGKEGDVLLVEFTVLGLACVGMNGGPGFPHTVAFSMMIETEDQAETDRYWAALTADGGTPNACGWCQDRFGVSWQITPRILNRMIADTDDPAAAKRAMQAMMTMGKIDIAALERAFAGEQA